MANRGGKRPSARALAERVSRCVSTMVYYQTDGWSWSGAKLLTEEADGLLRWAAETGQGDGLVDSVLGPVKMELIDRYGMELGLRLHEEFTRAMSHAAGIGADD